jgi:hypothetical protein
MGEFKLHTLRKGRVSYTFGELDVLAGRGPQTVSVEKEVDGVTVRCYGGFPTARARDWYARLLRSGYRKAPSL